VYGTVALANFKYPRQCLWQALVVVVLLVGLTESVARAQVEKPPPNTTATTDQPNNAKDILNLDLDQLVKTPVVVPSMDIPVTSVTKEQSTVGRSPAAVFVITQEMIRRSGATNIPDALRMAPGLDVAQVNSSTWAVSSRGFTWTYANKMLVLVDGRCIYNHDFSGVYWDVQDMVLEDIDRIEVVRGPGGTLWGANAMNGVINIITKSSKDTQGSYAMAGGGTHDLGMEAVRYGGKIGDDATYRVYEKYFAVGQNVAASGISFPEPTSDAWQQGRVGFRMDWEPGLDKANLLTVQGDHYVGTTDNSIIPFSGALFGSFNDRGLLERLTGENLLFRWRHVYDDDTDWTFQTYYDNYMRSDAEQTEIDRTFDVDFQYRFPVGDRHHITCGGGFRNIESYFSGGDQLGNWFQTPYESTNYTSQFVQDEIAVVEDRLTFTIGSKLEESPYTGFEYQPTARLIWTPDRRHSAWGAISRAVRTPSRSERESAISLLPFPADPFPVVPRILGNQSLASEAVVAYELGFREQTTDQFSWDVAAFYNVYDHLIVAPPTGDFFPEMTLSPHLVYPLQYVNLAGGNTYGIELAGTCAVSERWRITGQYTLFEMRLFNNPAQDYEDQDPKNQMYLRSSWDIGENIEFDMIGRYVDSIVPDGVPNYITMDLRLAYRPRKNLELAVIGQNLLQESHQEYSGGMTTYTSNVPMGMYGTVTWRH
jgi:iron complex outermembrane receptor protein